MEDIVLRKLEGFRRGGETSTQQWKDALGILKLHRGRLDMAHLRRWAQDLKVTDLLDCAWRDAGLPKEG